MSTQKSNRTSTTRPSWTTSTPPKKYRRPKKYTQPAIFRRSESRKSTRCRRNSIKRKTKRKRKNQLIEICKVKKSLYLTISMITLNDFLLNCRSIVDSPRSLRALQDLGLEPVDLLPLSKDQIDTSKIPREFENDVESYL